ncbi:2-oxoglutarate dehydrogenase complex component E1-like isoform X1 [Galleria mellonella]|uniref:2-oxoglutarate dehydrogenase, mitochondrial n=2 Tax=Galleria mellonella TaxID=7137 RepID=A0ABM3MZU0_GALME|nr:2-oxoglutarate dehydrogenase complex component E1-like isoform X1 [Galleria mellonella]
MALSRPYIIWKLSRKYFPVRCPNMHGSRLQSKYSSNADSFLSGANANFLEAQYLDWAKTKGAIDSTWDEFYDSINGPTLKIEEFENEFSPTSIPFKENSKSSAKDKEAEREKIKLHLAVQNLIRSYQCRGHLLAKTDPLGLTQGARFLLKNKNRDMNVKGVECQIVARELGTILCEKHMDMVFELPDRTFLGGNETALTLREIIHRLERVYCGSIGVEYMHVYDIDSLQFIRERIEKPGAFDKTNEEKRLIMRRLTKAVFLEKYFATKWPAEKRFGLEGGESMIVMLEEIVDSSSRLGVESIVIAMQHRGRLNMLVNVCRKQLTDIFAQFKPMEPKEPGSGDIKYHLGTYIHRFIRQTNKYIKVSMSANPSHLEVVSPVVVGKARAEQHWKGDSNGDKVMAIIIHGDAAFAGQGVVYETAHLSNLPSFTTHGSIHIVCNNQIGYTTDPRFARSSPYCSDVAKCVDAPVLHVNADDAEAVAHVARVAIEYRCKFKKDVVLDLVCYRRFGHSEEDEPMFTQPFMYKKIRTMETVDKIYGAKLKAEGIINDADIKQWEKEYMDTLNKHFELAKKITKLSIMDWIDTPWTGFFEATDPNKVQETGISDATISTISQHFCKLPESSFEIHKGIVRILANREKMVKEGIADWAMGEALAYGSLLRDKIHIRLTGEDVERGTMAHRHHVYHHQGVDGATYRVLDTLYPDQARYSLHNSSLSEFGILGFEVGYSYSSPYLLTIWEAQYGDFADTAQPVFDTFIANGESKWVCQSGLVVQLPHGIDGAGPEHSSARIERYLQQADDDEDNIPDLDDKDMVLKQLRAANWIVCNLTTPANYFHMIRRQIALPFRKPVILMTPKVGLKHPYYRSKFEDFRIGTSFQRAIRESGPASKKPEGVKKLIFCSGKVAITISELVKEKKLEDKIAMCRIEQLYPFPYDIVLKEYCRYENAKVFFCQEEHKNQGPWPFVKVRLENLFGKKIGCISRPSSSASATGIKWVHAKELKELKEKIVML